MTAESECRPGREGGSDPAWPWDLDGVVQGVPLAPGDRCDGRVPAVLDPHQILRGSKKKECKHSYWSSST